LLLAGAFLSLRALLSELTGCPGYETTSGKQDHNITGLRDIKTAQVSLTWALIELAKRPEIQHKFRSDIARFHGVDPTWDQLVSDLPYLDAVVLEVGVT
jgi:hypothetical protein